MFLVVATMDNFAGSMRTVTRPSPIKLVTGRRHVEKGARPVPACFLEKNK